MAKKKNKNKRTGRMQQGGEMHNQQQATNVQQKTQNSEEEEEANKANQNGVIVLGLNVHCPPCEERIRKSLWGFEGVERIEVDSKNNKVTIKGKKTDPIKVAERVKKKTGKHVVLISPKYPKKEEKKEEKKKELPVIEVVLKVYLYCPACAKDVKKAIHMMPGVLTVQPDLEKNLVTVKGAIEPEKLVEFVQKKIGKYAEIVKKGNQGQKDGKNEKQVDQNYIKDFYGNYPRGLICDTQLFSDENPNSCSII